MAFVGQPLKKKKFNKKGKKKGPPKDLSNRLYLRMARTIKEPLEVQDLHPLIKKVIMPRQHCRFCFLEFKSEDDATKALEDLKNLQLPKGKHIVVKKATAKSLLETPKDTPIKFRTQRKGRKNVNMEKLLGTTTTTTTEVSNVEDESA